MQRQGETATALPPDFDRFIGRDKQLAELSSLFARGARLVSIIGRPGIGKTRLARRFAGTMAGLEVVDALVPDDARLPQLLDALATRPELRVLVTTRAPLGVPGEARLVLGPLEVAAPLQDLGASEASELLLERAREVAAPEIEAWSAATLARALGGVPLALEHRAPPRGVAARRRHRGGVAWLRRARPPPRVGAGSASGGTTARARAAGRVRRRVRSRRGDRHSRRRRRRGHDPRRAPWARPRRMA